jgi:hypothetical protein
MFATCPCPESTESSSNAGKILLGDRFEYNPPEFFMFLEASFFREVSDPYSEDRLLLFLQCGYVPSLPSPVSFQGCNSARRL